MALFANLIDLPDLIKEAEAVHEKVAEITSIARASPFDHRRPSSAA